MDFLKTLFRCSSLGHIMTDPRSKSETLSETCKTHLIDVYVANRYGRRDDIQNKYITKGLAVEEDSITLYSRIKGEVYFKNEDHLSNKWIKGTPDLFTGDKIYNAETITDIKSSWDIYTFMRTLTKDVNKLYYWQLQGYMDLSGASSATLAYCLVDTPQQLIEDEKRRLMWKMGTATEENQLFMEACEELQRSMTFEDIALHERLIEFQIPRNEADIMKMHLRVEECRKWLNEFEAGRLIDQKLL
jgi:hypothetical protein